MLTLNTHILNSSAYTDTNYVFITEVFMLIKKERFHFAQEEEGQLMVDVTDRVNNRPIDGASVSISYAGDPQDTLEQLTTDSNGMNIRYQTSSLTPNIISSSRLRGMSLPLYQALRYSQVSCPSSL